MKNINTCGKIFLIIMAVFLTLSTIGCGKKDEIKKNNIENSTEKVEKFSTEFFNKYNLPYQQLKLTDVENTADEYLFYIENGVVYRTINDYVVVIVDRSQIREEEDQIGRNYSGEIYNIFEDDNVDVLKYSACGNYAIMSSLSTIPDWSESEIIISFMEFAENYE